MSELSSVEQPNLVEIPERSLEDIQGGQDRIRQEFEEYKKLYDSHTKKENEERAGLDNAMDIALEDLRVDLYEVLGANKDGNKLERFKAGVVDGALEKGEMVNELRKDPVGFIGKIKEGIAHVFSSVENFTDFVKGVGKSVWDMFTNAYEMGKGAVDVLIGLALGGAGALGFKGAKRLSKLRKKKKSDVNIGKSSLTGAAGITALDEGASVISGQFAKEGMKRILTKSEKLAMRPDGVEIDRWKEIVGGYKKFTIDQLKKAVEVEDFLMECGIKERYVRRAVKSSDIDTIQIVRSSPKEIIAYRFYGGGANQYSYFYSSRDLRFIPEHEIKDFLALPDNNNIERVSKVIIPKGSPMLIGKIAPQSSDGIKFLTDKLGGSEQIYYPFEGKNVKIVSDYNLKKLQNGN